MAGGTRSNNLGMLATPSNLLILDNRLAKLRRILRYQFDLELLGKYREARLIDLETQRGTEIRACLEHLLLNGRIIGFG